MHHFVLPFLLTFSSLFMIFEADMEAKMEAKREDFEGYGGDMWRIWKPPQGGSLESLLGPPWGLLGLPLPKNLYIDSVQTPDHPQRGRLIVVAACAACSSVLRLLLATAAAACC